MTSQNSRLSVGGPKGNVYMQSQNASQPLESSQSEMPIGSQTGAKMGVESQRQSIQSEVKESKKVVFGLNKQKESSTDEEKDKADPHKKVSLSTITDKATEENAPQTTETKQKKVEPVGGNIPKFDIGKKDQEDKVEAPTSENTLSTKGPSGTPSKQKNQEQVQKVALPKLGDFKPQPTQQMNEQ